MFYVCKPGSAKLDDRTEKYSYSATRALDGAVLSPCVGQCRYRRLSILLAARIIDRSFRSALPQFACGSRADRVKTAAVAGISRPSVHNRTMSLPRAFQRCRGG